MHMQLSCIRFAASLFVIMTLMSCVYHSCPSHLPDLSTAKTYILYFFIMTSCYPVSLNSLETDAICRCTCALDNINVTTGIRLFDRMNSTEFNAIKNVFALTCKPKLIYV